MKTLLLRRPWNVVRYTNESFSFLPCPPASPSRNNNLWGMHALDPPNALPHAATVSNSQNATDHRVLGQRQLARVISSCLAADQLSDARTHATKTRLCRQAWSGHPIGPLKLANRKIPESHPFGQFSRQAKIKAAASFTPVATSGVFRLLSTHYSSHPHYTQCGLNPREIDWVADEGTLLLPFCCNLRDSG